jgi:hypothetical protein
VNAIARQGERLGEGESTCAFPSPILFPWRGRGV